MVKRRLRQIFLLALIVATAVLLLVYSKQAAAGAQRGIGYCFNILVPSLFPFMVLGVFVVQSGLARALGRVLERPARFLFRLPGCAAAAIFMSMVGGYPVGARSISALVKSGDLTNAQGERMLLFCVNAGPAFLISAVGAGFLHNLRAGVILLVSQLAASLLLGVLTRFWAPKTREKKESAPPPQPSAAQALVGSTQDAAHAMLIMCCFVVLFAALLDLLRIFVTQPQAQALLSALIEVTGGCADAAGQHAPLWFFSLATGWGGLCVHLQILASVPELHVRTGRFFLFRLLHGMLAAALTLGAGILWPGTAQVFSNTQAPLGAALYSTAAAGGALLLMCGLFLFQLFPGRTAGKGPARTKQIRRHRTGN